MPGRTESEAVRAFTQPIQKAIGCFIDGKIQASSRQASEPGTLTLNRGDPTVLPGEPRLAIDVVLAYKLVQVDGPMPWKVTTTAYYLTLSDDDGELFAYHWHPTVAAARFPHVHVRGHPKRHVPTGRVWLEDVLALAVELGAKPRNDGWADLLHENRVNVAKSASWGAQPPPG